MAERNNRLEALFHAVKQLQTSQEQEAYLQHACKGDP
jgi:hypothetical protein